MTSTADRSAEDLADNATTDTSFANFIEAPTRLDHRVWYALRAAVLAGFITVVVLGFARPDDMLTLFWGVLVPMLPAVWMLAPGLWRNTCPLATVHQLPRVLGFSRERTSPPLLQRYSYTIAITAFVALVLTRKVIFNTSGAATSLLLLIVISAAFTGGVLLKGKSGWCSAFCPLLPIQRLYGQAPVARIPNAHCQPCVGCTPNCFDFNPGVAYVADQHEADHLFRGPRRLFAGAFPGLVHAFFTIGTADEIGAWRMYGESLTWVLGGIAVFMIADAHLPVSPNTLPPIFGAAGFVLFYGHGLPTVANSLEDLIGGSWSWLVWPGRIAAGLAALTFLRRAWRVERRYESETAVTLTARAEIPAGSIDGELGEPRVTFVGTDVSADAPDHPSILAVAEASGVQLASGCRMGVCGADPVAVVSGHHALSEPTPSELASLRRLGLGLPNRLACVARVVGACSVDLKPDTGALPEAEEADFAPDETIGRVVVIGNGVAGMTAADNVRRFHPDCEIDIVALEPHHLYNRMGISKLVYSPLGVEDLQLLPPDWHEKNNIRALLNTRVTGIDRERREVELAMGDRLTYDRLILATGSAARIPAIDGWGVDGCFSLRSGEHAVQIRSFAQEHGARTAFVAGGGLLGLEAAYSLHLLGLDVVVGERSERILRRQIDARASEILTEFFASVGITIRHGVEVESVSGDKRVESVTTTDGETLPTELFLVAAGITPNTTLAAAAGLDVDRGVLVDDALRTSDPNIYAIGDLAEHRGQIWGLWTVAVAHGEIAARNCVGASDHYQGDIPTTVLKGAGIDMTSFGAFEPGEDDEVEIRADSIDPPRYEKYVWRDGELVGGTFINATEEASEALLRYEADLVARTQASK